MTRDDRKAIAILDRRVGHLEARVRDRGEDRASYDRAEIAALCRAIDAIRGRSAAAEILARAAVVLQSCDVRLAEEAWAWLAQHGGPRG